MGTDPDPNRDDAGPVLKSDIAEIGAWTETASQQIAAKRDAGGIDLVTYCVANQKGGVGKTTIAINIAGCFARIGLRVAVWDIDPQFNATIGLGLSPSKQGTYFLLEDDEADVRELLQPTKFDNIFVVPGHEKLELLIPGVSGLPNGKKIIAAQAPLLQGVVDVNIFDTPGNLSVLTTNGLYAADSTIVPFIPGAFELKGIKRLDKHIEDIRADRPDFAANHGGKKFGIDHVVVTSYDSRENMSKDAARFVSQHYPRAYIDIPVARRTGVTTAQGDGTPITVWEPTNAASIAFMKIGRAIAERDKILV